MKIHELWIKELMRCAVETSLCVLIHQAFAGIVYGRLPLLETLELNLHPIYVVRVSGDGVIIAPSLSKESNWGT